jgi:hypothetical protein
MRWRWRHPPAIRHRLRAGALAAAMAAGAVSPAGAENAWDTPPTRSVRIEGRPDRFLVCDQPGGPSIVGVALGRQVVSVAAALVGRTVALDPQRCDPPPPARASVQCNLGQGASSTLVDVRYAERMRRAGRGIFGERWEYRSLRLRQMRGREAVSWIDHEIELPEGDLFEDRVVRHVGTRSEDGCGLGFLVIRSHRQDGAGLALYALAAAELQSRAVSAPLGSADRWRDVIGMADVVGDGRQRIVEVVDPHRSGRLQLDTIVEGRIEAAATLDGYTSHRFGTLRQGIGALIDLTGDGVADIVVPGSDWRCLALVTARRGMLREIGRLSCGEAPIVDVLAIDLDRDGRTDMLSVRADGTIEAWMR